MRKILIILLLIPTLSFSQFSKESHKLGGHAIAMGSGYALYKITKNEPLAYLGGLTLGVLAGAAKESYDNSRGYGFNKNQFADACWGAVVGTIFNIVMVDLNKKKIAKREYYRSLNNDL